VLKLDCIGLTVEYACCERASETSSVRRAQQADERSTGRTPKSTSNGL